MGNFEEHLQYGLFSLLLTLSVTLGFAYFFIWPYKFAIALLPLLFGTTIFGALLPDIDHHNSRPYKTIQYILPLFMGNVTLASWWIYYTEINTILQQSTVLIEEAVAFLGFILAIVITLSTRQTIAFLQPKHRGITHTVLFMGVTAIITSIIAGFVLYSTIINEVLIFSGASLFGIVLCIGIASHLYCDEILFNS